MSKMQITYRFERQPLSEVCEGSQEKGQMVARRLDKSDALQEELLDFIDYPELELPNAELQPSDESSKPNEDMTWSEFPSDFGTWHSPFDLETDQLEKMIRDSNENPLPEQSSISRSTRSTHSTQSTFHDHDKLYPDFPASSYLRRTQKPWGKMIAAVSGAIITGVLFGFFVLSLFTTADNEPVLDANNTFPNNGQVAIGTDLPVEKVELGQSVDGDPTHLVGGQDGVMTVNIPSKSFFVLQNGMFSTLEGAESALQLLVSHGFAAGSEQLDHYYVYAGISANRDDALLLSHHLHQNDFETYIKMITLPSVRAIQWQGESVDKFEDYVIQGNQLVEMISSLSVIQLQQSTASAIDPTFMTALTEAHQSWNSLSTYVNDSLPDAHKAKMQKVTTALNTTMITLDAYRKNPSFSYLWQTQSALLDYVVLQKEWLESIVAQ